MSLRALSSLALEQIEQLQKREHEEKMFCGVCNKVARQKRKLITVQT